MAFVAGDLLEITVNHPELGTKTFYPKAGEAFTYDLGGFRSNDDAAGITGNGQMITTMSNMRASFEGPVAWDANDNEELEFLKSLAGNAKNADWTISWINGTTYGGSGRPVGDIQGDTNAGTIALKVACATMKKIT